MIISSARHLQVKNAGSQWMVFLARNKQKSNKFRKILLPTGQSIDKSIKFIAESFRQTQSSHQVRGKWIRIFWLRFMSVSGLPSCVRNFVKVIYISSLQKETQSLAGQLQKRVGAMLHSVPYEWRLVNCLPRQAWHFHHIHQPSQLKWAETSYSTNTSSAITLWPYPQSSHFKKISFYQLWDASIESSSNQFQRLDVLPSATFQRFQPGLGATSLSYSSSICWASCGHRGMS